MGFNIRTILNIPAICVILTIRTILNIPAIHTILNLLHMLNTLHKSDILTTFNIPNIYARKLSHGPL